LFFFDQYAIIVVPVAVIIRGDIFVQIATIPARWVIKNKTNQHRIISTVVAAVAKVTVTVVDSGHQ
jgi:hypothetical protein